MHPLKHADERHNKHTHTHAQLIVLDHDVRHVKYSKSWANCSVTEQKQSKDKQVTDMARNCAKNRQDNSNTNPGQATGQFSSICILTDVCRIMLTGFIA